MIVHRLVEVPSDGLGAALERFEQHFTYPLGDHARFRISHGHRYLPFFSAMGEATVLVAEHGGEVLGTLACIRRTLKIGESDGGAVTTHYLCDLKVEPRARGGLVLGRLILEARRLIEPDPSHACHAIVMDGTGALPTDYTGRIGIPGFRRVADIVILRLSKGAATESSGVGWVQEEGQKRMERPVCRLTGGDSGLRSAMSAVRIGEVGNEVWGTLEDTRLGKRLWLDTGEELVSGHVSGFGFRNGHAGAEVLKRALELAEGAGMPGVFVSMPPSACAEVIPHLNGVVVQGSGAGIYGHDLPIGHDWWVDTAEI